MTSFFRVDQDNEAAIILWNIWNYWPNDTVSLPQDLSLQRTTVSIHIFGYFNFWNICLYFLVLQAHEGHVHPHHPVQNLSFDLQLPVSVFYEALCPDSIKFFKEQLLPTYKALGKYINLNFVPFGKARQVSAYFPVQSVVHTLSFFKIYFRYYYSSIVAFNLLCVTSTVYWGSCE